MHDWDLKTNIDGIYAAGDQLYASDCCGFACATGYYAGRKAADYCRYRVDLCDVNPEDVEAEKATAVCAAGACQKVDILEGTEYGDLQGYAELLRRRKMRCAASSKDLDLLHSY